MATDTQSKTDKALIHYPTVSWLKQLKLLGINIWKTGTSPYGFLFTIITIALALYRFSPKEKNTSLTQWVKDNPLLVLPIVSTLLPALVNSWTTLFIQSQARDDAENFSKNTEQQEDAKALLEAASQYLAEKNFDKAAELYGKAAIAFEKGYSLERDAAKEHLTNARLHQLRAMYYAGKYETAINLLKKMEEETSKYVFDNRMLKIAMLINLKLFHLCKSKNNLYHNAIKKYAENSFETYQDSDALLILLYLKSNENQLFLDTLKETKSFHPDFSNELLYMAGNIIAKSIKQENSDSEKILLGLTAYYVALENTPYCPAFYAIQLEICEKITDIVATLSEKKESLDVNISECLTKLSSGFVSTEEKQLSTKIIFDFFKNKSSVLQKLQKQTELYLQDQKKSVKII